MQSPAYYRELAFRARRIAIGSTSAEVIEILGCLSRDYDTLAMDLEDGAIALIHPELLAPKPI